MTSKWFHELLKAKTHSLKNTVKLDSKVLGEVGITCLCQRTCMAPRAGKVSDKPHWLQALMLVCMLWKKIIRFETQLCHYQTV